MTELVVVGCGTVVPEPDRAASSYLVSSEETRVLFDCGPGAVQAMCRLGLPWASITDLFVTHFHADHVGALPGLFFAFKHGLETPRDRPLAVRGPRGTRRLFERLADALGDFMLDPGFPLELSEVEPDAAVELEDGTLVRSHATPHTEESLAYRLDAPGGASMGYSGDTGPSQTLGPFMRGVSALVLECSLPEETVSDNHLSPRRAASIAGAAGPGTLVLTHIYPHLRQRGDVERLVRDAGYTGAVRIAGEGLTLPL